MSHTTSPPSAFQYRIPVRWGDLDAFNHVNNANYLRYLEEARVQWLHTLADDWGEVTAAPVMAAVQLNYRMPISWPGDVIVTQSIARVGSTSLTIANRIESADGSVLHADGEVVLVWIDRASGQPVPLPDVLRAAGKQ
ncbi:thioesterase family protein [Denitratimonas sp. CY0512]|uniref:acyl-CoA thioesterase n=1 Tax=Denitratimonas sp. CY0512 TaxID=3131940 RepID=UPI0030A1FB29